MTRDRSDFAPVQRVRAWIAGAALLLPVSLLAGSACALFLWSLDAVTRIRFAQPWLLFGLPVAGWMMARGYAVWGKGSEAGTRLILAEVDALSPAAARIPRRMAPLILLSTLLTHLFGGSAGREGTAVQMGGSIAASFLRAFSVAPGTARLVLSGGIAAGFGGVFGTPLAGALFAVEVAGRRKPWEALPFFAAAAFLADVTCRFWGITHTTYGMAPATKDFLPSMDELLRLAPGVVVASVALGACARAYLALSQQCSVLLKRVAARPSTRALLGGILVIALYRLIGTPDYLGLGVLAQTPESVTLPGFFESPQIHPWSWLWKMLFTIVTLAAGFRGGEVTPLFFIGAGLGNALSGMLGAPSDLFAGLGLIALFGAAAKTPWACWMLGLEMFGTHEAVWMGIACWGAFWVSGKTSLYSGDAASAKSASSGGTQTPGETGPPNQA